MTKLIGIVGFLNSGKNTVGNYICNEFDFESESFAASLKDATSSIFGWDREMLEGITDKSRDWRDQVDSWWEKELEMPGLTPRKILQVLGTDVLRNNFHNNIWIASVKYRLEKNNKDTIITDCRFYNEINMIHELGGKVIRIKRGEDPEWMDVAREANQYDDEEAVSYLNAFQIHSSEYSWVGGNIDYTIENLGTKEELLEQVFVLVKSFK